MVSSSIWFGNNINSALDCIAKHKTASLLLLSLIPWATFLSAGGAHLDEQAGFIWFPPVPSVEALVVIDPSICIMILGLQIHVETLPTFACQRP